MKRILTIITILFAVFTLSPRAAAEGAYFGVRGEAMLPVAALATAGSPIGGFLIVPLFGIQGGYDFASKGEAGFGIRASLTSLIAITRIGLEVLYSIPNDASGAGWYVGAGVDTVLVMFGSTVPLAGVHVLAGYNFPISSSVGVFTEVLPGWLFTSGPSGYSFFYVSLAVGLNFHL
jgi:hypothetical protein